MRLTQVVTDELRPAFARYRAVLADVLTHRCGASAAQVSTVFPGFSGATLGITTP